MSNPSTIDRPAADGDWQADWEGHRQWQFTALLTTTPAQRLAWLEEVLDFAYRVAGLSDREDRGLGVE